MSRRTFLTGGPIVGGPLGGVKIMAYGGPAMPAIDRTGRRVGTYLWDDDTGQWEFDGYGDEVDGLTGEE